MLRDPATLLDLLKAARLVVQFIEDASKENFYEDFKTQSAVLHQLMIIGEAVKRLSPEFRKQHPEIPWKLVAGMRDSLIHEYDDVDLDEVWNTVTSDIPRLIKALELLAPKENTND